METKKVIITGANGYLGKEISRRLSQRGHQVIHFVRNPKKDEQFYDLAHEVNEQQIAESDILIHCAFITKQQNKNAFEININGTKKLIEICEKNHTKFVFISSLAAHELAESDYGKHKLQLESLINLNKNAILKPGLVIGQGGLCLRMIDFAKKYRVIPIFNKGEQPLQFVSIENVALTAIKVVEEDLSGKFTLVSKEKIEYITFYKTLEKVTNTKFLFIPLEINTLVKILDFFEKLKIKLPVDKENLLGLKKMQRIESTDDMQTLGLQSKSLYQILHEHIK